MVPSRPGTRPATVRADARPRLSAGAILLTRPGGELQVGLDPAWRIHDPDGRWQHLLSRLDGRRTWRQLAADPVERAALVQVVRSLADAGLADPDGRPRRARTRTVRLVGTSPLAAGVGDRLLEAGVDRLYTVDPADRLRPLRTRHPDRIRTMKHWTKPETPVVPLTVLVAETVEISRTPPADLLRRDLPHLLVRPQPGGAVVGPLVVPGRTACLGCTDLGRRDADPAWPALLTQLARTRVETRSSPVTDWAVALTVTQVLAFLAGQRPETWGATLELSGHTMAWRPWPRHAECGCRWPG